MRPVALTPSVNPRVPIYPPGGPGLGQQIFYGQGPPAIIPPQVIPPLLVNIKCHEMFDFFSFLISMGWGSIFGFFGYSLRIYVLFFMHTEYPSAYVSGGTFVGNLYR